MMNMYPFFGFPYYRRPSPYYTNYNSVYNVKRNSTYNSSNNADNIEHISKRNLKYNNLHNLNNFPAKNVEKTCSPNVSSYKKQENFDNSNFSDFSSKNYVKSKNDNFKNFESAENTSCNKSNNLPYIDLCSEYNYSSNEYFEIFGLKLHFDDLLIICILFFLYQEDVKDTYLYISLILLLLS